MSYSYSFPFIKAIIVLVSSSSFLLHGQEPRQEECWFGVNGHYGFIAAHHESMQYLVQAHAPGFEVNVFQTSAGKKKWQRDYHNPELGARVFFISLSNPEQLGFGCGIYPYINFPIVSKKNVGLKFSASLSVGYLSRIFDPVDNFKNSAVGSHFNGTVNLRLNAHNLLAEKLRLEYGVGLTHFSNGAFRMPNLGVNIPTLNLGLAYKAADHIVKKSADSIPTHFSKNTFTLIAAGCKAEVEPPTGQDYGAFTLSASYDRISSNKHRFIAGIEMGYNGGNEQRLKGDDILIKKKSDLLQAGIKLGYALRIGNLELPAEFGYYLHTFYKGNGVYFHRIGIRYYLPNNLVLNGTLKTHWAKADYWEFGLGYVFKKRKAQRHDE